MITKEFNKYFVGSIINIINEKNSNEEIKILPVGDVSLMSEFKKCENKDIEEVFKELKKRMKCQKGYCQVEVGN